MPKGYGVCPLNILYDNRVSVVVRARESLYMAKGDSELLFNMFNE